MTTRRPNSARTTPATAGDTSGPAVLARNYDHPDAQTLVAALYEEQVVRYGYADPAEADVSAFRPPAGLFVVTYVNDVAVGCGGFRTHDAAKGTAEIKKMYTVPAFRGQGIGRLIIAGLLDEARRSGVLRMILETGVRNSAALALYASVGFIPIDRYVDGRDPKINRAFAMDLSSELP